MWQCGVWLVLLLAATACPGQELTNGPSGDLPSAVLPGASVVFDSLLQLGPLALLAAFVLFGSYLVRASALSNRVIPWVAALIGAVSLEFLFPVADLAGKWAHPRFVIAIYGFIVAVFVWMVHEFALSRFEDFLASKGLFPKRLTREGQSADKTLLGEHAALMETQADQMAEAADRDYTRKVAAALRRLTALVLLPLLLFTGCKSAPAPQSIQNRAKGVAYLVTAEALLQHPEWRPGFATASDEFRMLGASTNVSLPVIAAIVQRLPVKELQGRHAAIVVTAATLFLQDSLGETALNQPEELRRAAQGIHEGIDLGLQLAR